MATRTLPATKSTAKRRATGEAELDFQPAMTPAEVFSAEAEYNETWGVKRRIAMVTLTKSRAELTACFLSVDKGVDAMFSMIEEITELRDHLKAGASLAESAIARLLIAGQAAAKGDTNG